MDHLETLFREGMAQGFIKKDLDAAAMSLEAMCFIEGYIYMSILGDRMPMNRALIPIFNAIYL